MRYSDIEKDLSEFLLTLLTKIGYLPRSHPDILLLGHIKKIVYSQVHNKRGVKINRGGFKDFEKLINGGGVKISGGGVGQNIEEKRRK